MTSPPAAVLGSVVFWSVPPRGYATKQVCDLFEALGLEPTLKPKPESTANAFRRMRTDFDGYRYTTNTGDACLIRCRDGGRRKENRMFSLERHLLAGNGSVVAVADVGWAKFYYPDPRKKFGNSYINVVLTPDYMRPGEAESLEELKTALEADFDRQCRHMDAAKLRITLRWYMHVLDGIQLTDSMFFVPTSHAEHLDRVHQLLSALDCPMRRMEVTGGLETVQALLEAATDDLARQLAWVPEEIDRTYAKRTNGVTVTSYLYIRGRYDRAMGTVARYNDLLGPLGDTVADAALAALDSLTKMEKDAR